MEGLEFPEAEIVPVHVEGRQVKGWVAVVNKRTREVYNIPTDSYELVQHKTVFDIAYGTIAERYSEDDIRVDVTFTRRGARMFAKFLFDELTEVKPGDIVRKGIMVTNSYDGSMGVWTGGYFFRLVCSNGLVMPRAILKTHTIHTGDTIEERIRARVEEILENLDQAVDIMRAAAQKKITWKEAVELVDSFDLSKSHKARILKIIREETGIEPDPEEEVTLWDVYNGFTCEFTHNIGKMNYETAISLSAKAASQILVLATR